MRSVHPQPGVRRSNGAEANRRADRGTSQSGGTTQWDQGYTWYLLTIDGSENTAYLIQWVENVGWRLEHAGWVWAEKGYVGYGGFGLQNNGILGNFLFRRPADKPMPSRADL